MKFKRWFDIVKTNRKKIYVAFFFFAVAITIYFLSGDYLTDHGNFVSAPDLILDNIGYYHLGFIFVWLFILVILAYLLYPIIYHPEKFPYAMNMLSLFIIIRSGFIIFTHLGVPYGAIPVRFPSFLQLLNFSNDLFFSGHTGLPFLGFLIYRGKNKLFAYFMLASSIVLAITVLLMHIHYSIDVFSAYFITYGIYKIGNRFVK